jgi:hypothetical protein
MLVNCKYLFLFFPNHDIEPLFLKNSFAEIDTLFSLFANV